MAGNKYLQSLVNSVGKIAGDGGEPANDPSGTGGTSVPDRTGDEPAAEKGSGPINPADLAEAQGHGDNGGAADEYVRDAAGQVERNKDGSLKRKRGRKPGGKNAASGAGKSPARKATNSEALASLTQTLKMLHLGVANLTKYQSIALADAEAQMLAQSINTVMKEFEVQPNPKITAVAGLISACAIVYGPRVILVKMEHDARQEKAKRPEGQEVAEPENPPGVITMPGTQFSG